LTRRALAVAAGALALAGCGLGSGADGGGPGAPDSAKSQPANTATAKIVRTAAPRPRKVAALVTPANPPAKSVQIPVLTWHRVNPLRKNANAIETDLTVEPPTFVKEMLALKGAGFHSVTQKQLFDALYEGAKLPARPVMITVDDGYVDDVRHILPALKGVGYTATFFIITDRFHEPGFLDPAQIRRLDRAGMDIGDHTQSHIDMTTLSGQQLVNEIAGSKRELEHVVGHPVSTFCYPSGRFNDTVVAEVKKAGYALAYTTMGGNTASTSAPLTIPRFHIGRSVTPQSLLGLIGG
jgi:peptidoglycan/xylan/chitin deacetylase (PgdA/CDA1 family)